MSPRHPELTTLVSRLRNEQPRPKLKWSELLAQVRATRSAAASDRVPR